MALGSILGGGAAIGGALLGAKNQADANNDARKIAEMNLDWQRENAQANRDFSREIINMSRPDLTSDELTNLLLMQGEQQANKQRDRNLSSVTRDMTRAGIPSSGNDIIARTIAEMSAAQGDRGIDARLRGTMGVLPGAAALQIGGSLYNQPTPQMNYQPQADMMTPLAIGGIGNLLGRGLDWYLSGTGLGNQTTGGSYNSNPANAGALY